MKSNKPINPGFYFRMLSVLLLVLVSSLASAADYQLIDLGPNVTPKDINSQGVVSGARNTDQNPNTAFRWSADNGFEDIDGTSANATNDAGLTAGSTITGAFTLDGSSYRSWDEHNAYGVNELGNVAGNAAGKNPYRQTSIPYNPAILEGNKWTVIDIAQVYPRGTRQGVYADVYVLFDINENGFAVGRKSRYGLAGSSAILIAPPYSGIKDISDVTFLPTPYGGTANAINAQNMIVGTTGSDSRSGNYAFAYLYDGVSVKDLGRLPGGLTSGASDINDFGLVVGTSGSTDGPRAYVWDQVSGMQDLNDLIVANGWVLSSASAINNAGEIVGTGTLNGQPHGFLLTSGTLPTPGNVAPLAVATSDLSSGRAPLNVNFEGGQSTDSDGYIASYAWDFGDSSSDSSINPSHTYTQPGTYVCVLTVTDDGGLTNSVQLEITVRKSRGKLR